MSRKLFVLGLVAVFALGYAVSTVGAKTPKPRRAGQLSIYDSNGKKVGRVVADYADLPSKPTVAFKHGRKVFFVVFNATTALTQLWTKNTYFKTDDCSGQAFLEHSLSPSSPGRMALISALVGDDGTVWVADPTTATETITAKSRWGDGVCVPIADSTEDAVPGTQLCNCYDADTGPFEIR